MACAAEHRPEAGSKIRIDKWLWAARFFKTRSLAAHACGLGRIHCNGQPAKASREIRAGDHLRIVNDGGVFQIAVLALSDMRGPTAVARMLYRETEESEKLRLQMAEQRKTNMLFEGTPVGKPSKRDRRVIDRFRGRA